ncbi:hypothetical protein BV20DRAFT_974744 [Pilatotrama ljubarskyi]|nr:hypothetical protein BV20DRAFT_974744 [Pilatotrama ljubarskyi]
MDPEFAAAVAPLVGQKQASPPTIAEARAEFDQGVTAAFKAYLQPSLPPDSAYTVRDEIVDVDGGQISVRCLVPVVEDERETFPVFVNIHGGGWSVGTVELDDYFLRILCDKLKMSVVNVEYRLAPEHPFPTPVDDCFAALKWTVLNTPLLKADLKKGFIVGGHSAGANLSAVLAHMARDDPFFQGRQLTGQLLREPMVVHPDAYPEDLKSELGSMKENADVPPLSADTIMLLYGLYGAPPSDPRFSPLLYPSHRALPRAYIQAMALDPLRDDALVYDKVLRAACVETKLVMFPGVSHDFHYNFPAISLAAKVREDVVEGLKWLLGREA